MTNKEDSIGDGVNRFGDCRKAAAAMGLLAQLDEDYAPGAQKRDRWLRSALPQQMPPYGWTRNLAFGRRLRRSAGRECARRAASIPDVVASQIRWRRTRGPGPWT